MSDQMTADPEYDIRPAPMAPVNHLTAALKSRTYHAWAAESILVRVASANIRTREKLIIGEFDRGWVS